MKGGVFLDTFGRVEPCNLRIQKALAMRKMKQIDLVSATNLGSSAISQYVTGKYEPKQKALYAIAKALNVSEAWLMGFDVPMERIETIKTVITSEEKKILDLINKLDNADIINLENYIRNVLLVSAKYNKSQKVDK